MDQGNNRNPDRDLEMERNTEIRRDSQVRGSLGIPPSGEKEGERPARAPEPSEGVPEFDSDERMSER